MKTSSLLFLLAASFLSGCAATVQTQVVQYNPAVSYPPTASVEVLLQKPERPHIEIGLIEARGESEAQLIEALREKARALGADAIVKLETERLYHSPVPIYDPWYDPFYFGYHRPFPFYHSPWSSYRYVGGGFSYVMKATAVRYSDKR